MTWDLPPLQPSYQESSSSSEQSNIPVLSIPSPNYAWPATSADQLLEDLANLPDASSTSTESLESHPTDQSMPKVLSNLDLQPTIQSNITPTYSLQSYQPILQPIQTPINVVSSTQLVNFLDSGSFSDVSLIVGESGREFRAHKVILAAKSPVFRGMFSLLDYEKILNIEIKEVHEDVMYDLLKFIYEDQIERIESCGYQLCLAAEKFEIPALRERCCAGLLTVDRICINDDNVYDIVDFAIARNVAELKRRAVEYVIGVY
ncbi:hypothetical protein QAD02_011801 [Eretmocerus hayati]|uniref:Uncharacterized protein n=1 Tax=Eretmocerus hayati TaxID=131215 RepID=A0ACC2NXJ3_9HYME|nr:hypothetical protein QAD02_011801 [Eretmocerus hayati]